MQRMKEEYDYYGVSNASAGEGMSSKGSPDRERRGGAGVSMAMVPCALP